MRRSKQNDNIKLINRTQFRVRFSEVDSMAIVWHGEYVRYFEDGREAFGREFEGLGYMDMYNSGYAAPMVEMDLKYKYPLRCNDTATVETRYIGCDAAKIIFEYVVTRDSDQVVVATGRSVQVFIDPEGVLQLNAPEFYENWKIRWIEK